MAYRAFFVIIFLRGESYGEKSKGLIVAVVLLVLLVIGLALYICYNKGIIFSSNRNDSNEVANDEKNEEDNGTEDEDIESELTDGYVIKDINKKVNAFYL